MVQPADLVADVTAFHEKFDLKPLEKPGFLSSDDMMYRFNFLREELDEIKKSFRENNLAETLDGLVDLVYVAIGTAYLMGLPFSAAWVEVQRANMLKARAGRAEDSKRGSTLDVIKPPGWTAPDIARVIEQYELNFGDKQ